MTRDTDAGGSQTPPTMPRTRALIERAEGWSNSAREMMKTRGQIARRNLLLSVGIGAVIGLGTGGYTVWQSLRSQSNLGTPWPLLIGGLACLSLWLWLRRREQVSQGLGVVMVSMLLLSNVAGIAFNGVPALTFVAAFVVLYHVVLTTRTAAWLTGAHLAGALGALLWREVPLEPQIASRALGGGVVVMLAMQLLSRHWDRLDQRFSALSDELVHTIDAAQQKIAQADAERARAVTTDVMTGLPNLEGFVEAGQARWLAQPEALVACLHLQRWRSSMSTLHYAEQQALFQLLLQRCTETLGPQALIGRAAMDELLILLPAQGDLAQAGVERLEALLAALARPVVSGQRAGLTSPALGYARSPRDHRQLPELIERATLACESARLMSRDRPVAFEPRLQEEGALRSRLAADLQAALEAGHTALRFRPVFDARHLAPRGAISSMVWNHPVFGPIDSGSVQEASDNLELTHRMTVWRLQQAFSQARRMKALLGRPFRISLSLPQAWLTRVVNEPSLLLDELALMQIEPGLLVLEFPEDAMLQDPIDLMQLMSLVRSMGMGVALDGFGAGFSSFSYLDRMALDYLKIDPSFVAHVGRDERETAVCRAIVRVAHALDIGVVADCVRHAGQARLLSHMGCDLLCGDGLAATLSGPDLGEWVLAHPSTAAGSA